MFIPNEAIRRSNQKIKDVLLSGGDVSQITPEQQTADIDTFTNEIKQGLAQFGNTRFIKPSEISTKKFCIISFESIVSPTSCEILI